MSNTPTPLFDMSKAIPIEQALTPTQTPGSSLLPAPGLAPEAAPSPAPAAPAAKPLFDMSTARPIEDALKPAVPEDNSPSGWLSSAFESAKQKVLGTESTPANETHKDFLSRVVDPVLKSQFIQGMARDLIGNPAGGETWWDKFLREEKGILTTPNARQNLAYSNPEAAAKIDPRYKAATGGPTVAPFEKPIMDVTQTMTPEEQREHPYFRAGAELTTGMTSPNSLGLLVASGGLGRIPGAAGEVIPRLASAGFAAPQVYAAWENIPAFKEAWAKGDANECEHILALMTGELVLAAAGGEHAIRGEAKPILPGMDRAIARYAQIGTEKLATAATVAPDALSKLKNVVVSDSAETFAKTIGDSVKARTIIDPTSGKEIIIPQEGVEGAFKTVAPQFANTIRETEAQLAKTGQERSPFLDERTRFIQETLNPTIKRLNDEIGKAGKAGQNEIAAHLHDQLEATNIVKGLLENPVNKTAFDTAIDRSLGRTAKLAVKPAVKAALISSGFGLFGMPHWMMSGPILEAVFGNGDIVAMMNSLKASPNQVLRKAVAKVQAENPGVPTPAPPESSAPLAPETPAPAPAGVPPAPTAPGAPSAPSAPAPAGAMSIDEARRLGLVFNEPIGTSTGERTMPAAAPAPAPAPASENNHFGNFSDKEAAQAHLDSHVGQPGYDNARVVQLKNGKFSVVAPKPVLTPEEKTAWFDVEFPGRASEPQETKVAEYDQLHEKHNVIPSQPRPSAQGVDELMNTTRFRQNAIFDDVRKEFGYGAQLPKDRFTLGHTQRVTALATKLAQEMGLDEGAVARIQDASILHDVGKGNQEYWHLLNKPGKLTPAEYEIMAKHEADSAALVGKSKEYNVLADIVGNHHTAFTKNPPLEAQVIAVSDIYDAVREPRPYKTAMTQDAAIEVLNDLAEKGKLNPDIVNRFVKGLKEGKYEGIGTGRQRFNDYGFLWWGKPITSGVGPDIRYDVTPHLKDLSRGQASPIPTKFLAKAPVRATMVVLDNDGNPHFADDNRQDLGLINPPRKPLNRAQMDVIADALGRAKR